MKKMPGFLSRSYREYYFVAGAAGAAGAAGLASGAGAPGAAGLASGAGAGAGAGAGVSTAGFCSSAFLHPTTVNENVPKRSRARKIANVFFIDVSPPFKDFQSSGTKPNPVHECSKNTPFFYLVKLNLSRYKPESVK